jgi:cytoskeletal protein RodZ
MGIGGELRRARTARKLSLADIAARTKINQTILRAIEDNRFDRVPGGLFRRGYLRAYAREVHLDPEEIVERYRAEFEPAIADPLPAEETTHGFEIGSIALLEDVRESRRGAGLAVVLLIGAAYFGFARSVTSSSTTEASPKPTDAAEATAPAPKAIPTTGTIDAPLTGPLKLAIETKGDCWVAATIDGKTVIGRLMKTGEREQFDVHDRAALRVGEPSAFSFTLNGIPGRVIGTARTAVNLTFDRQNYKSILRETPL